MRRFAAMLCVVFVLSVSGTFALTFDVTVAKDSADGLCDSHCSLREAVIAANESPGGDIINLPQGVYRLTLLGPDEDGCQTGDLDVTEQLNIYAMGWDATIVDGLGGDRVFDVRQGAGPVQLSSMTIRGGLSLEGGGVRSGLDTFLHLAGVSCVGNKASVQGGAVLARGSLVLADCQFAANSSDSLAGAVKTEGALEIVRCSFSGNRSTNGGGAVKTSVGQVATVDDSLFVGNTGAYGGALSVDRTQVTLTNVTFSGNAAVSGRGGAIATNGGNLELQNCTMADDTSVGDGTEIDVSNDPEIFIENSIVSGPGRFLLCSATLGSRGHNLTSDESCGLISSTDILGVKPGLRGLKDNGGPSWTLALLTGSLAIDSGGGQFAATDQRGVGRPIGSAPDRGAYEAQGDEPPIGLPMTVPVIAHLEGVGGTPWRSDVAISNPGDGTVEVMASYTPGSGSEVERLIEIAAGATVLFEDIVDSAFAKGDGQGAFMVTPPEGGPVPVIDSRTFAVSGSERLGQGMPAMDPMPEGVYFIPGLREDAYFRSNLGIVAGESDLVIQVDLYRGADGAVGSTFAQTIPAGTQNQWRLPVMFPNLAQSGVPMTAKVRIFGPGIPYGSLVDQMSTDAVTLIAFPASSALLIPVVAHNPGAQGTFWQSDLFLHNPNPVEAKVYAEYLPEETDNQSGGLQAVPVMIPAFGTVTVPDVAGEFFDISDGKGVLMIIAAPGVAVASRTYTTKFGGGGTFGLGVPALPVWARTSRPLLLTGIRVSGGYRTNIGIVGGERREGMEVSLLDHDGNVLDSEYVYVEPRSMAQESVRDLFPDVDWGAFTVGSIRLGSSGQLRTAYSSTVDGSSQDPVFAVATAVR